jgi:hypothetical protein
VTTPLSPGRALIGALAVLILNDWLLKPAFGNWWTGKLSDVAGLLAFALCWIALLPRRRTIVVIGCALAFMFWKSAFSTAMLELWNASGIWPLTRVIDYSDWLALLVLVPAWHIGSGELVGRERGLQRAKAVGVGVAAVLAFSATSVARPLLVPDAPVERVAASMRGLIAVLDTLGFDPQRTGPRGSVDTIGVHVRHPPERWVPVWFEAREGQGDTTALRVTRIGWVASGPVPATDVVLAAFHAQVVELVRQHLATSRGR